MAKIRINVTFHILDIKQLRMLKSYLTKDTKKITFVRKISKLGADLGTRSPAPAA